MMKTTPQIIISLREKLQREPTPEEVNAERIRLGKLWYGSMAISAITLKDEK